MLRRLLNLAAARGASEVGTLARALGASPRQTTSMLETLERQGYLARTGAGCGQPCSGCPLRAACPSDERARLWALTPKGLRLLGRGAG